MRILWRASMPFLLLHLAALYALCTGATRGEVVLCLTLYLPRMFFITAGYHRYFAHRGYRLGRPMQFLMALGGTLAGQKGPLWWAGHHRYHHRHADEPEDIHSPRQGFWWSHVIWFLVDRYHTTPLGEVRDFARFPELRFLDRYWILPPMALAAVIWLAGGGRAFLVGFCVSTVLLYHATYTINSLAHIWGRRRYATGDDSRNSFVLALITGGEGWHNNHHHYPAAANQGFFWWELDPTYYGIRVLSWLGLATGLRTPPSHVLTSDLEERPRTTGGAALIVVLLLAVAAAGSCHRAPQRLGSGRIPADGDPAAASRGEQTLLGRTYGYGVPFYRESAYWNVWKVWGLPARPPDFEAKLRERYGLHPAPYDNGGLPMGLTWARDKLKGERGFTVDCMLCHGGSIGGTSMIGLPNTTLDMEQLMQDFDAAEGRKMPSLFPLAEVRGLNNADAMAAVLTSMRRPDLSIDLISWATNSPPDLGWTEMPQIDTPAWWIWKPKKWIYYDGIVDARSHTSGAFTLTGEFHSPSGQDLIEQYDAWMDVRVYVQDRVRAPPYPLPIDAARAARGAKIYHSDTARCADCHGTYEGSPPRLVDYSTPITPLSQVQTDPERWEKMTDAFIDKYNSIAWYSANYKARRKSERPKGYVAPPLTGLWATAPYLHNGSVPTVLDLLSPAASRPARYYRLTTTDLTAYDPDKLGWKVIDCPPATCSDRTLPHPRMIYDTSRRSYGNGGHTWGVDLGAAEKRDLVEFLKTL
ncbi:MAG TPA: acyl-CoA desaturase [Vicinamibacteria bacterium]